MKHAIGLLMLLAAPVFAQHDHSQPPPATPAAQPAPRAWTSQPLLLPGRNPRGERAAALLRPQGIDVSHLTVYAPEGPSERRRVDYPVGPNGARIESATPKIGNYHWVIAREETPELVKVASTAWYFGNPGASPRALLKEVKHELEIVPDPLPREHGSYRESEKWRFLVRFMGQPLANQPLTLETEFGSRSTALTDAAGIATVLFPRDFKPAEKGKADDGGHGPRRAKFVLFTAQEAEGRRYLTAFNHTYGEDLDRNRSLGWGAVFGLAGMLAATPLLRRRNAIQGDANDA
ncbi:MAG: DUF4198 domain-containing protein [Rhodocyclaceae bacterium]|nr:DUF4198 domain-containing protein [Rhodocyclaceae bacterium]